jgi:hypothetical protein
VVLTATTQGLAEVRRRRRRLERLVARALANISTDEAARLAQALDELRAFARRSM